MNILEKTLEKLVLIDAHALIHRAYHALPELKSPNGQIVNAVYGFCSVLIKIVREIRPKYLAAAFDLPAPTFRHQEFKEYKAQRPKMPDDLIPQISLVRNVLQAFCIPAFQKEGFEADDIIGTIVEKVKKERPNLTIIIATGDLDTLQLVGPKVKIYTLKKGVKKTLFYTLETVKERFGLSPEQMADFKGLSGDSSDNIPGVPGIGPKTASYLIQKFDSIENIYQAIENGREEEIGKPNLIKKLKEFHQQAIFSKYLATIRKDVPIDFNLEQCFWEKYDFQEVEKLFQRLGFPSLLKRLQENGLVDQPNRQQKKLF